MLAGKVDMSASALKRGRLARRLALMRQVHAAARDHAVALAAFDVSAAMIADLDTSVAAAEAMIATPRSRIVARRSATANLKEAFTRFRFLLEHTLDSLMKVHGQTDPDTYHRYLTARRVIDHPGNSAAATGAAPQPNPQLAAAPSSESQPLAA